MKVRELLKKYEESESAHKLLVVSMINGLKVFYNSRYFLTDKAPYFNFIPCRFHVEIDRQLVFEL